MKIKTPRRKLETNAATPDDAGSIYRHYCQYGANRVRWQRAVWGNQKTFSGVTLLLDPPHADLYDSDIVTLFRKSDIANYVEDVGDGSTKGKHSGE